MKGKTIITAVLLAASFGFAACTGGGEENSISSETGSSAVSSEQSSQTEGGSSVAAEDFDFKSIKISWNYCTAEDYVYEAETDGEESLVEFIDYAPDEEKAKKTGILRKRKRK